MTEHQSTPPEPAGAEVDAGRRLTTEDFRIRIFTIADHGVMASDGKLYLNGAGIETITVVIPESPLPPLYVVGRIAVPYQLTSEPHRITLRLLDADRNPVLSPPSPDPIMDITGETGRPPGTRPGDEVCLQFAFGLLGVPVPAQSRVFFHLAVDGRPLGVLPLRVLRPLTPGP
jgi:hypothetical protein